jgi:glycosyltransferase involved in cell wall biosynthesis
VRVLCLTSSFPRHPDDLAGRFVHDLASDLAAAGDDVRVVAPDAPGASAAIGLRVHRVPYFFPRRAQRLFYRSGAPENLARDPLARLQAPGATLALAAAAAALAPAADVILAHWIVPAGLAGALAAAATRRPLVVVAHSGDVHLLSRMPGGALLLRFVAARAAALCAVAADVQRRLGVLGVAARTLPLGAALPPATAPRAALRRALGLSGRSVLLGIGRLEAVKGYDVLVEAARGVPRATVILAGDGSERERLRAQAASAGVDLRLAGVVAGTAKANLFAACDAAVFPSRRLRDGRTEGLPVALLEALCAGAPIVASAVGGIPEAAAGAGLLVPPDDAAALHAAVRRALRHRGAFAARSRAAASRYDRLAAARRYRDLLREVAGA